jgi:hypothetical protein
MSNSNSLISYTNHAIAFASNIYNLEDENNNSEIFEPLYEIVNSYLSNGYAIIYGVESLQNHGINEKDRILNQILKSNINMYKENEKTGVNDHHNYNDDFKEESVIIIDANSSFDKNFNDKDLVNYWYSQFSKVKEKIKEERISYYIFFVDQSFVLQRRIHVLYIRINT